MLNNISKTKSKVIAVGTVLIILLILLISLVLCEFFLKNKYGIKYGTYYAEEYMPGTHKKLVVRVNGNSLVEDVKSDTNYIFKEEDGEVFLYHNFYKKKINFEYNEKNDTLMISFDENKPLLYKRVPLNRNIRFIFASYMLISSGLILTIIFLFQIRKLKKEKAYDNI